MPISQGMDDSSILMCPKCHSLENTLRMGADKSSIKCSSCGEVFPVNFGIPVLIERHKLGIHSDCFLGIKGKKDSPPVYQLKAAEFGFEIVDYCFFGRFFSFLMGIKYRGINNSRLLNTFIYRGLSRIVEEEEQKAISEADSTNMLLVLRRK